jgi:hypothetical protein
MNVTTSTFSLTQMILAWTLLGLLLSWMITFTVLALHSFVMKKDEWEDLPMPSRPFPALSFQSTEPQRQHSGVAVGDMLPASINAETYRDIGTTPIK